MVVAGGLGMGGLVIFRFGGALRGGGGGLFVFNDQRLRCNKNLDDDRRSSARACIKSRFPLYWHKFRRQHEL